MMSEPTDCSVHPGTPASRTCASCGRSACERCLAWEVDGSAVCDACGVAAELRSGSAGSTVLGLVGLVYLATLALSWLVFRARPYVGGLAAIAALVAGRALQAYLGPGAVARRETDAAAR
jgi:hypothetical protein